jgi:hypothetical protein
MKTAVEWFLENLRNLIKESELTDMRPNEFDAREMELLEQAKEKEKQAHKETWDVAHQAGRFEGKGIAEENWQTFEGYWEENFKQQEQ